MKTKPLVGALTLVLALLGFVTLQPANANPLVDPSIRGTLTIVKHSGDPLTQFGDPSNPIADTNREPIPGVEFTIQKISNLDLSTNEGWIRAQDLVIEDFYAGGSKEGDLGGKRSAVTGEDGRAVFTDLEIGAYYVTETASSAQRKGVLNARPFVVTIPQTTENGSSWNYDVVVQAKNQLLKVTHQAGKTCFKSGETIDYGVSATVPPLDNDGNLPRYELYVPLNGSFTSPVNNKVIVTRTGEPTDIESDDAVVLSEDDFEVTFPENVARLVLKESGLQKVAQMRESNPAAHVTWLFDTSTNQTEKVTTTAYLLVDGYPEFDPNERYGVESNEVTLNSCTEPDDVPIPVPVPKPDYNPDLFPGTSVVPVPVPIPSETPTPAPKGILDNLASTGANVLWVFAAGLILVVFGVILRRKNNSETN